MGSQKQSKFRAFHPTQQRFIVVSHRWQQCVGTVTVMRQDKKPLTPEAIETLWMYAGSILDLFGEGDDPKTEMTPWGLLQFCEEYREGRLENGHQRFEGMALPL
eukprot:GHVR01186678.1.p1 GENE.GHVR01186678.1~~GHVR01186678.1.p1  ORF type:complete len:104 (+),score=11.21 GHVR01186678.1:170-481(+)